MSDNFDSLLAAEGPMLAGKFDPKKQEFPCFAQPKLDGIRASIRSNLAYSRTNKQIPNGYVEAFFMSYKQCHGLDGELIVGNPCDPECYRTSMSGIMSGGGEPDFTYHVFDIWNTPFTFRQRHNLLNSFFAEWEEFAPPLVRRRLKFVETKEFHNLDDLMQWESEQVALGHEGIIIRGPQTPYKFGRATTNQGQLIKVKRFVDSEAVIIGMTELMTNQNEATKNDVGATVRSSHKERKLNAGTMGALVVTDLASKVRFQIGTGFDQALRQKLWDNHTSYVGQVVKYKAVTVGGYDAPRFPVFLGFRDKMDMGTPMGGELKGIINMKDE